MKLVAFPLNLLWLLVCSALFQACSGDRSNRVLAEFKIESRPVTAVVKEFSGVRLTTDPLIVFHQAVGYSRKQDRHFGDSIVEIHIEIKDQAGNQYKFTTGTTTSGGCGAYWANRDDGLIDLGASLVTPPIQGFTVKLEINDPDKKLQYPMQIRFEKLNELP